MRPRAFRRACVLALLTITGISAGGCDERRTGAIRVTVIGEDLSVTDPSAGPLTAPQEVLLTNVAQGLVQFDARGQIEPGLAERWTVSDDGLSYIFRLAPAEWANGDKVTAHQVARLLRRALASRSSNPMKDSLGAVAEIVAMTDRVLEVRLKAPRPNLLQLLAQPELAILREGGGTGPFRIAQDKGAGDRLRLERSVTDMEVEERRREQVTLAAAPAPVAVQQFIRRKTDLVLGGTFVDLPYARAEQLPRDALQFDPVAGLFGLAPARNSGPIADPEVRALLSQAIDRQALIAALDVPGLLPRASILQPGLDGIPPPAAPEWMTLPLEERRAGLIAAADRLFGGEERPVLRIALPEGPGADLLLNRLASDWAVLGFKLERASRAQPADIELVDRVAPSTSAAWFLRQFRCDVTPVCETEADELLEGARGAPVLAQRHALLSEAAQRIDQAQLFIPLAAPIRWSLVSPLVQGFAGNRFARHTLTALEERLNRERAD